MTQPDDEIPILRTAQRPEPDALTHIERVVVPWRLLAAAGLQLLACILAIVTATILYGLPGGLGVGAAACMYIGISLDD